MQCNEESVLENKLLIKLLTFIEKNRLIELELFLSEDEKKYWKSKSKLSKKIPGRCSECLNSIVKIKSGMKESILNSREYDVKTFSVSCQKCNKSSLVFSIEEEAVFHWECINRR